MRRLVVLLLAAWLLWVLLSQVNHELAPWNVSLFLGGLFVAVPGLRLTRREGLMLALGSGLLHDASAPFLGLLDFDESTSVLAPAYSGAGVWFGTHAFLFVVAQTLIYHVRLRIPREETLVTLLVALLSNLGIFLGISFVTLAGAPRAADAWPRLMTDLVLSQTVLALVGTWFFALQARAVEIAGSDLRVHDHGAR